MKNNYKFKCKTSVESTGELFFVAKPRENNFC